MALISCPDCGQSISTSAPACIHCGRPTTAARPAPRPSNWPQPGEIDASTATARPDQATTGPSAPAPPQIQEHAFFPVATHKFVVMSLCTFGIYELYWCYKNWQRIKEKSREDLSPFWRAFFAPLWGFSLFERIHEAAVRRHLAVGWSAGLLGTLYLVLSMTWRLPDPWWLISVMTFAPFIPVMQTIQEINAREPAAEGLNSEYSGANIATVIIGGLLLVFSIVATFIPAEAGT